MDTEECEHKDTKVKKKNAILNIFYGGRSWKNFRVVSVYPASSPRATGTAVVVCPGGGYLTLAMDHEGSKVAQWLNTLGVTAFVLKYRVGTWDGKKNKYPIPFMDATRAVRTARTMAREWGIDPERIGIMGFSAGGHLASTVGTHFDGGNGGSPDVIERTGSRPNFMILVYPVISFKTEYVHRGSRASGTAHFQAGGAWVRDDFKRSHSCHVGGPVPRLDEGDGIVG